MVIFRHGSVITVHIGIVIPTVTATASKNANKRESRVIGQGKAAEKGCLLIKNFSSRRLINYKELYRYNTNLTDYSAMVAIYRKEIYKK